MSNKLTEEQALVRNLVITHAVTGLSSNDIEEKNKRLDEILKLHVNEVEYKALKEIDPWWLYADLWILQIFSPNLIWWQGRWVEHSK